MSRKTSPHRRANSRRLPLPELSDEAAYMMQFFIEDFYLWFSRAYATHIVQIGKQQAHVAVGLAGQVALCAVGRAG